MDSPPGIPQQKNLFILVLKKFFSFSEWLTARDFFFILLIVLMATVFGLVIAIFRKDFLGFVKLSLLKIFAAVLLFIFFGIPFFVEVCPGFPLPPGASPPPCGTSYVFRKVWDLKEPCLVFFLNIKIYLL